jgi:hypothetical protein
MQLALPGARAKIPTTRPEAVMQCAFVAVTALACAGLLAAAALVPAPPVVLPFLAVVCIGSSMVAGHELPVAIAGLRRTRRRTLDRDALDAMRRQLDQLPETPHPLGL